MYWNFIKISESDEDVLYEYQYQTTENITGEIWYDKKSKQILSHTPAKNESAQATSRAKYFFEKMITTQGYPQNKIYAIG